MDISIITPTWRRRRLLLNTLEAVKRQSMGTLQVEHIVIADGPDPWAKHFAKRYDARYFEMEQHQGGAGGACRDRGLAAARGEYVVFWDDDNTYHSHAIIAQYTAAHGVDIGICQVEHAMSDSLVRIPSSWNGQFQFGNIDGLCACVRRNIAITAQWSRARKNTDFHWLTLLAALHDLKIRFVPVTIGCHVGAEIDGDRPNEDSEIARATVLR